MYTDYTDTYNITNTVTKIPIMTVASSSKVAVFRAIAQARRSTKRFQIDREIPAETLTDILQSTIRTASSFNLQPTQIIMVTSQATKDEIASEAMLGPGNQFRTQQCSAVAVFLSDLEAGKRIQRIHELETDWGKRPPAYMAMMPLTTSYLLGEGHAATLLKQLAGSILSETKPMPQQEPIQSWCYKNTSLMAQSYVLAAESHDLGTSMMEGMDTRRLKKILRIPDRYAIPMVVATGYDYENETDDSTLTPRLPLEELVFQDSFGVPYHESVETFQDEGDDRVASV